MCIRTQCAAACAALSTCVSTFGVHFATYVCVRAYAFALSQDHACSCDRGYVSREEGGHPPAYPRRNDETNATIILYIEGSRQESRYISKGTYLSGSVRVYAMDMDWWPQSSSHATPCEHSRHMTPTGGGIPMHMPLPCYLDNTMWGTYAMWCSGTPEYILPLLRLSHEGRKQKLRHVREHDSFIIFWYSRLDDICANL